MIRRPVVILLVLAGLGLILWAGVSNYRVREVKRIAAQNPGQQMVLTPSGVATPDAGAPNAGAPPEPPNPLLGKQAPEFQLKDTQGKTVSLSSFRGRPVMVNFWATWCGPCKYEIPWLVSLRSKYTAQGFEILGVDADSLDSGNASLSVAEKARVIASAKSFSINYPVLYGNDAVATRYGGVDLLPQSFYIDKTGRIVAVITGAGSRQEAESDIRKAIGAGA